MPYTKFAISGAGNLGRFILAELVKAPNASIKVLTRSASTFSQSLDSNASGKVEIVQVDFSDSNSLEKALKGVEVLLCTFPPRPDVQSLQFKLIDAATNAGCKLFVPSEFGNSTLDQKPGERHELKLKVQKYAGEKGLPTLLVFNGAMADLLLHFPPFGFDWEKQTVTIVEGGNYPITMTARSDIARFLVHALTTWEEKKLVNQILRLEGDRPTPLQVVEAWEGQHPDKGPLKIVHRTLNDLRVEEEAAPAGPARMLKGSVLYNYATWIDGTGNVGTPLSNSLWPEWQPAPAKVLL